MRSGAQKGFTLLELLIATAIMGFALCGILAAYLGSIELMATSKNINIATNAAQGLIEEIRNYVFINIVDDYDGLVFTVNNLPTNRGVVYVNDSNPDLLRVTISICWQQKGGRVIGEDKNLNGVLDAGEDTSTANNIIDSPVQIVTLIANR